jgi:hypothetical protein
MIDWFIFMSIQFNPNPINGCSKINHKEEYELNKRVNAINNCSLHFSWHDKVLEVDSYNPEKDIVFRLGVFQSYDEVNTYLNNLDKQKSWTVEWYNPINSNICVSYFYCKSIREVIDKFYVSGNELLRINSIVLNPIS